MSSVPANLSAFSLYDVGARGVCVGRHTGRFPQTCGRVACTDLLAIVEGWQRSGVHVVSLGSTVLRFLQQVADVRVCRCWKGEEWAADPPTGQQLGWRW